MEQLQIGEEIPTAAYPKEQTRIANSQEHSAVNRPQIEKTVVTLDNLASTETEELRELPIIGPAGDSRLLLAGGPQANLHGDLILTIRGSGGNRQ